MVDEPRTIHASGLHSLSLELARRIAKTDLVQAEGLPPKAWGFGRLSRLCLAEPTRRVLVAGTDPFQTFLTTLALMTMSRGHFPRAATEIWRAGGDVLDLGNSYGLMRLTRVGGRLDALVATTASWHVDALVSKAIPALTTLHEFAARAAGLEPGIYEHDCPRLHIWTGERMESSVLDMYRNRVVEPFPVMESGGNTSTWFEDLSIILEQGPIVGLRHRFFRRVATPLLAAHKSLLNEEDPARFDIAKENLLQCLADDWRHAAMAWVHQQEKEIADDETVHLS